MDIEYDVTFSAGTRTEEKARLLAERHPEIASKKIPVEASGVTLSGRADRVDLMRDGTVEIIDYKTGVSGQGEDLHERYELQAKCYAYAVLSSGAASAVDLVFVRPEAGLEEVCFSFTADQIDELASAILAA